MANKQIKLHNAWLYGLLGLALLLTVMAPVLLGWNAPAASGIDAMEFWVEVNGKTQKIHGWQQEQDGACYVFLPAQASTVQIAAQSPYLAAVEGFDRNTPTDISTIEMEKPYPYTLQKGEETVADGQVVFMQSANVPALFLNTDSGSMEFIHAQKGNAEAGSYTLVETQKAASSGAVAELVGRGNTSWDAEKKGYALWFEEPVSLLGMEPTKKYVLNANAGNNYLSNTLAFWLSSQIGVEYVTQNHLIDLWLNGDYAGNYLLCEPIYVGDNGIPIADLDEENFAQNKGVSEQDLNTFEAKDGSAKGYLWKNDPPEINGGYLIERDVPAYYAEDDCGFILSSGDHYVIKSPRYASQNQVNYIKGYMQEAYDAIAAPDGIHPTSGKHYSEYIDVPSFVLKYTLEEFLAFNDAGRSSAYYYKDTNGLVHAGPGWDFGGAFLGDAETVTHLNSTDFSTDWYLQLCKHQSFRQAVTECYNQLLSPAVREMVELEIPRLMQRISASAAMDTLRWQRQDFAESCREIQNWSTTRASFLDDYWNETTPKVTVTFVSAWQNKVYVYLSDGEVLDADQAPIYEWSGYTFQGWENAQTGQMYTFGEPVEEDLILTAVWQSPPRSTLSALLDNGWQLLPELVFGVCFVAATVIFVYTTRKRRMK